MLVAVLGGIAGYLARAGSLGQQQLAVLVDGSDSVTQNEQRGESDQERYERLVAAAQAENQKVRNEVQGIQGESVTKTYPVADLVLPIPYLGVPFVDRGSNGFGEDGEKAKANSVTEIINADRRYVRITPLPFLTQGGSTEGRKYPTPEEWKALTSRRNEYAAIDLELAELSKANENNPQANGDRARLEQRRKQLEKQLGDAERVLAAHDLSKHAPVNDIPPAVGGVITTVKKHKEDTYVEVTVGSDDGIRKGHNMEVFRGGDLLGRIEIVRTTPDRSVGKIDRRGQVGEIRARDRVEANPAAPVVAAPPESSADRYVRIVDNPFYQPLASPLSTFSIDVDTASYANVRQFLLQQHRLPPPDAVRIEELINYFDYSYGQPKDNVPFAAHLEVAACPWQPKHRLARIALKGKEVDIKDRPRSNLVFLLDVSGSMQSSEKLPLVIEGMKLLVDQLRGDDHVAIVVYAGAEGLVLNSTPASERAIILQALENLRAGGSTNGGAGIQLAYQIAADHFVASGINRVILCTDGDFNVGVTADGQLERLVVEKAKTGSFLTVLGFGSGNLNDAMMENISNKGNGNYAYIDSLAEAQRVLVQQATGTLLTIAKDVKLQVEFNPAEVARYRLIGYGNRLMDAQDFNDDTKDAGEIGAGHTVTAFYEIVPTHDVPLKKEAQQDQASAVDPLKYQRPRGLTPAADSGELFALRIRYKRPDENKSQLLTYSAQDNGTAFNQASADFQFAAAVASFGMMLRGSEYAGDATYKTVLDVAQQSLEQQESDQRNELVDMVRAAIQAAGSK